MGLEIQSHTIFTAGEWIELSRAMPADAPTSPALTALSLGEQVDPFDTWSAINLDCRMSAGNSDTAHELLDRATQRLRQAWPDLPR
ncbi:MAG: hypothetical protein JWM93_1580 [Frankiales bacterium]|nr:hypothetical protein [Frankiales bacterium]